MSIENTSLIGGASSVRASRRFRLNRNGLASQIAACIGSGILVLWAAVTLSFLSLQFAPGDIVTLLIGEQLRTPEVEAAIRAEWGLNAPLFTQYLNYLGRILHGDFGRSYILQTDVYNLILSQILPTLKLTAAALVVAIVFAVASAVLTAGKRLPRSIAGGLELVLISTPSFWLGIILLFIFSFTLKLFPVSGDRSFAALVLPALSLGLSLGAVVGQVLREGLERALEEPFALTVRSWGTSELVLKLRHCLRHAALPAITLTGWLVGNLLSGAVITEAVFGRPGLGRITVDAVLAHDMPVVLAVAIISAFIYVVLSMLVDVVYLFVDPRLRNESREAGR
ncbi:Glutathione transport system permease protein GsiC [Agrobacterium sp. DSM 25558]|uniref:ABC transporter permease n=1 Tax=Agrobacterium sp. DSM 25558 TaxID=1907665 RepID=UPI0009724BB2|nr:ABC transporter permease [Agrobacterium sp. DSM 25558]SCX29321.1 Glutathione transport system permease protein GsiC [Agrobacterium sp. DSM 25558]